MVELLILVVIVAVVVLSLRPRKSVLDEPLVIERAGYYHITLDPQLRGAQPFLENIAGRTASGGPHRDTPVLFYRVQPAAPSRECEAYLLAVALRGGMLYLQAIRPVPLPRDESGQLKLVREFSTAVLVYHPLTGVADAAAQERVGQAVAQAAAEAKLEVQVLR